MPPEISWNPVLGKKIEAFFDDSGYKEYLESAVSFNRKLNEERKMRLPYIDGQTGVAQKHYGSERFRRERMPGLRPGQIFSYPQKHWRKKRYQYLKYFMQPKRFDPETEMHTISQVENPSAASVAATGTGNSSVPPNEDSNTSAGGTADAAKSDWPYYDEENFMDEGDHEAGGNSDSDFEYEDSYSRKRKSRSSRGAGKGKGGSKSNSGPGVGSGSGSGAGGSGGGSSGGNKRRTHADNIPDSEKPFSCELCGARYKTRPGLSYHYNHTHKEKGSSEPNANNSTTPAPPPTDEQQQDGAPSAPSSVGAASLTPPSTPGGVEVGGAAGDSAVVSGTPGRNSRRSGVASREDAPLAFGNRENDRAGSQASSGSRKMTGEGKERAVSLGYCDFCLGDSSENKKTNKAEELVSCAECGRSGHPTCLQFSDNMIISVREYPWQCIECKCCTLCGTSENDDQLLFCDDCDRGYHMYCLVPPIKEPPEGSWSCSLCIERFHKK